MAANIDPLQYRPLVYKIARSLKISARVPIEDLRQVGMIGLIRAIEKYEEGKTAFSIYATFYIKSEILRAVSEQCREIRLPHSVTDGLTKITKLERQYRADHGEPPTDEQRSHWVGWSIERLRYCQDIAKLASNPVGEDEAFSLRGREETPWQKLEREDTYAQLRDAIATLPERQRDAISLAYGLDGEAQMRKDIAKKYGVTPLTITRDVNKALDQLKKDCDFA